MSGAASVDCELAGPAVDAVAHLFAHVIVPVGAPLLVRAASLFDAAYVAWARAALPVGAITPIARDAPLLGALLARDAEGHRLQWLLVLHDGPEQLRLAATRTIDALEARDVACEAAREALAAPRAALDAIEIARCAIALAAPVYVGAWSRTVAPGLEAMRASVAAAISAASSVVPAVRTIPVRLCQPLGARGRAFPDRLLVGVPTGFGDVSPEGVAARVVHEVAARVAGEVVDRRSSAGAGRSPRATPAQRWALSEHLALEAASKRLAGTPLAAAHRTFSAGLDRSELDPGGALFLEEVMDHLGSSAS